MIRMLKKFILSIVALSIIAVPIAANGLVFAAPPSGGGSSTSDAKSEVCSGLGVASAQCSSGKNDTISNTLTNVINLLSLVAGFAGVIMIIVSGIRFITAQGESSGISAARTSLIYALVGLIVAALAQIIVHFVFNRVVTG